MFLVKVKNTVIKKNSLREDMHRTAVPEKEIGNKTIRLGRIHLNILKALGYGDLMLKNLT